MISVFLVTTVLSQFLSNTATTVLMAPLAFRMAVSLGLDPRTLLMLVAAGASTALSTPMASPVNTLVLGPGGYKFGDFLRAGIPLQLLLMGLAIVIVPQLF